MRDLDDWRLKISVLWIFYAVAFLVVLQLGSLEPGVMEHFLSTGEIGGLKITSELLLVFAVLMLVPLVMAFLSLALKDSVNRWANVIVGVFYTGFQVLMLVETFAAPSAYAILMEISKVVVPALIVWYAWKSNQKA